MASKTLKNASLTINSVDLSAFVQQVTISRQKDTPQATAMGDNSHEFLADGLKNANLSVTFKGDYVAGAVDPTLDTIYDSTSAVTFTLLPDGGTPSVSNPSYSGSLILTDYSPVTGSVGDLATVTASFQVTGDITSATA